MKENKYYTPDISEFRVGFEYEYTTPFYPDIWIKEIMTSLKDLYKYDTCGHGMDWERNTFFFDKDGNLKNYIRVKYLDTQDIKELGFTHEGVGVFMNDNGNMIAIHPDGNVIILHSPEGHCLFDGKILNKSELKWILTRIGVL